MNFSHYNDHSVRMAVALVNTLDAFAGADALTTPEALGDFLATHGADWHDRDWWQHADPDEKDVREVQRLRKKLREVWEAASPEQAVGILNELLVSTATRPRVSLHNEPHMHFEPQHQCIADWIGSAAAMALATVVVHFGYGRLGLCGASNCDDVYVDTSRNRSRRHCTTTCTTRENVAAHRARSKTNTDTG